MHFGLGTVEVPAKNLGVVPPSARCARAVQLSGPRSELGPREAY